MRVKKPVGHAEALNAGRMGPSVCEFDELGGGSFKKGAAGTLWPSGALVAQLAMPPASAFPMKGRSGLERATKSQCKTAMLRCKTSSTRSGTERSDEKAKVPKDVSDSGEDCDQDNMEDPEQGAKDLGGSWIIP